MIFSPYKLHRTMAPEERNRACRRIVEPSRATLTFYVLVCLSAIIATFGLLANSTAVVIGAMLVAPLMGPIFGIALSLSTGDRQLLKTAVFSEIAGIILAIGLPVLIGLIPLRPEFGSEILARTQPTIYDVLIALASGLAGAYALVDEKISPALPGVAIATALVPPLAACGLNLSAGNWMLAWGAFLLFLVNFIAIECAAASIFIFLGLVEFPQIDNGSLFKAVVHRLGISFIILLVATSFMTKTLINVVEERRLDKEIRTVLSKQISAYAGARLSDVKFDKAANMLQVMAVIITPQELDSTKVTALEQVLQTTINANTHLIVRSLISKDADSTGPVFVSAEELLERDRDNQETTYMNNVSQVISEAINPNSGRQLIDVAKELKEDVPLITASVRTPQAIDPAEVHLIESLLKGEVDNKIQLVVRSVITKDASSKDFLNFGTSFRDQLQDEELKLYRDLLNECSWYISQKLTGTTINELTFTHNNLQIDVNLVVNTPETIAPVKVAELQNFLQGAIDPGIQLRVRSIVGGTATASAYTTAAGREY